MGKFSRYFWTALKNPRLGMYEIHNFVTRTYAKAKFKKHGLIPYIAGLSPDVYEPQFGDLWHLYSLIRKRRPELALEFGSGYSTIIMAQAIHENG
ncbi:MAG TPA: hypothetical protein DDZ83_02775, partial [Nitrospinae bacterium]|nr:hypothetical protein [Nitrospinota bacterium]